MARFILRSLISTVVTMFLVSFALFFLVEVGSGDITVKILGVFSTPEQRASYRAQLGLDQPWYIRYLDWLVGSDWRAERLVRRPLVTVRNPQTGEMEWWAQVGDELLRWDMEDGQLYELVRQEDGSAVRRPAPEDIWRTNQDGEEIFWGVDDQNRAAMWIKGKPGVAFILTKAGMRQEADAPHRYIPLRKGLLRGDPGMSLMTGRPVMATLPTRIRNTFVLAALAFIVVMPLALFFGILAGVNEGKPLDRTISISSLALTATPEFVTGVFLILIFGIWLRVLPPTTVFLSDSDIWNLKLLVLPVLTLTAVELGYVARMTRASMVEVMNSPYIRTAILKGMPFRRVVFKHAVRNALMAPITVIMLHVNWLVGGIVVVEVVFGFPGLGSYIYDAAIFGDFNAVEAAAMLMVTIAVGTRLVGDVIYTLLNPRIRYS